MSGFACACGNLHSRLFAISTLLNKGAIHSAAITVWCVCEGGGCGVSEWGREKLCGELFSSFLCVDCVLFLENCFRKSFWTIWLNVENGPFKGLYVWEHVRFRVCVCVHAVWTVQSEAVQTETLANRKKTQHHRGRDVSDIFQPVSFVLTQVCALLCHLFIGLFHSDLWRFFLFSSQICIVSVVHNKIGYFNFVTFIFSPLFVVSCCWKCLITLSIWMNLHQLDCVFHSLICYLSLILANLH